MDTQRMVKLLGIALRGDAGDGEVSNAFNLLRSILVKEKVTFEDVFPSVDVLESLRLEAAEMKRIIGLSRRDYAAELIDLKNKAIQLESDIKQVTKERDKLQREKAGLEKKLKDKKPKTARNEKVPKPGEAMFIGPMWPKGLAKPKGRTKNQTQGTLCWQPPQSETKPTSKYRKARESVPTEIRSKQHAAQ